MNITSSATTTPTMSPSSIFHGVPPGCADLEVLHISPADRVRNDSRAATPITAANPLRPLGPTITISGTA